MECRRDTLCRGCLAYKPAGADRRRTDDDSRIAADQGLRGGEAPIRSPLRSVLAGLDRSHHPRRLTHRGTIGREHEQADAERRSVRTASLLVSVPVNRGVAEDGSPAAPIGGTILIPLWLGFGLGHAPRGPGAAGKESHHPGPAPPRLAFDDPFKMPPSAGFSRIAVEMELVSHDDHPDGRDRRQDTVGSLPENTSRPRL